MTDHNLEMVLKAAQEAGFEVHPIKQQARVGWDALTGDDSTPKLERFWAIAYRAGLEKAAEICGQIVLDHPGRADLTAMQLERAIRAHAQNQPKNVHDSGVVSKK